MTAASSPKLDAVVVGNGVLGASAALALARGGMAVARVGRAGRPFAASAAAGAMLGCFAEVTAASLASDAGRAKLALAVEATARWPAWSTSIGISLPSSGTRVVDDEEALAPIEEAVRMHHARFERNRRGIYLPDEHWLEAPALLACLDEAFSKAGGAIVDDDVAHLHVDHAARGVALASGETLESARVLVAAGAKTQTLLAPFPALVRRTPRITAGFGEAIVVETTDTHEGVVRTANRTDGSSLHLVPRGARKVYVGATNVALASPRAAPESEAAADAMLDRAIAMFGDALDGARVVERLSGNRPMSEDGAPLAGATSIPGLFLLGGTQRDGLHLSPLLAEAIANEMAGTPDARLRPFVPERL